MGARARVVSQPDAEVFHLEGLFLRDLRTAVDEQRSREVNEEIQSLAGWSEPVRKRRKTYDIEANKFSCSFLDLAKFAQEIPEARLGNDIIWRKDAHAVELGLWLLLGWQLAANNLVLA